MPVLSAFKCQPRISFMGAVTEDIGAIFCQNFFAFAKERNPLLVKEGNSKLRHNRLLKTSFRNAIFGFLGKDFL